jgi:uncharacterized protein with HEPN domain
MQLDTEWLGEMVYSGQIALGHIEGIDGDRFLSSLLHQDAVMRRLTIMGEAAKRVSPTFRAAHPEIPWRQIAGFRDIAVHDYTRLDMRRIWELVQSAVPVTVRSIESLITPPEPRS